MLVYMPCHKYIKMGFFVNLNFERSNHLQFSHKGTVLTSYLNICISLMAPSSTVAFPPDAFIAYHIFNDSMSRLYDLPHLYAGCVMSWNFLASCGVEKDAYSHCAVLSFYKTYVEITEKLQITVEKT